MKNEIGVNSEWDNLWDRWNVFLNEDDGATIIEYAIVLCIISAIIGGVLFGVSCLVIAIYMVLSF